MIDARRLRRDANGRILVGIDADGVVVDIIPGLLELYNEEWDDHLVPGDITAWDMSQFVRPECGKAVYKYFRHPDLYNRCQPMPGAKEGMEELREAGVRPVIVTANFDGQTDIKRTWLRSNEFLPSADKDPLALDFWGIPEKALAPVSLLLDDYDGTLDTLPYPGLLFPAPYNAHRSDLRRVSGWPDAVAQIRSMLDAMQELDDLKGLSRRP